jgi:hypothetical protein
VITRSSRVPTRAPGRWPSPALAIVISLAWLAAAPADEAALPPSPEGAAAAAVQPASFESAPAWRHASDGPLPLSAAPAAATAGRPAARPIRPLGDWKVLAAIAAAFVLVAAFRLRPLRRTSRLPPDVFELLGEASLGGPHALRVVRFGPRTLLVGVSAAGCQTLAEIDDPQATERIAAACRQDERLPPRRPSPRVPATVRTVPAAGEAT